MMGFYWNMIYEVRGLDLVGKLLNDACAIRLLIMGEILGGLDHLRMLFIELHFEYYKNNIYIKINKIYF